MFFIGVGGGGFPTVLTLIALGAATPDGVIALSAYHPRPDRRIVDAATLSIEVVVDTVS